MQRLVSISAEVDTPLDVLAACREVHPQAELVYVGHNRWWLGYVKQGPAMDIGYPPPNYPRYQYDLQRQGFRWLGEYGSSFISGGYLRQELEFMFGRTDSELAKDQKLSEEVSDGTMVEERKLAAVKEAAAQEGRSIYAHVQRKRRGVLFPATPIGKV